MNVSLFPLPLSLFEYYMFLDDRAGNSMTFPLTAQFEGRFDRNALEEAYTEARKLHPLFYCTVSQNGRFWLPAERLEEMIWLETKPDVLPWSEQRIDITQTPGLRFAVFQNENTAEFHFLFHHVVSDGLGFFQFLNSLFECYARRTGRNVVPKSYDSEKLREREHYDLVPPPYKVPWYRSLQFSIIETIRWLRNRPLSLASSNTVQNSVNAEENFGGKSCEILYKKIAGEQVGIESKRWNRSGFLFVRLSRETTSRILGELKQQNQTVAGYFLSRLFISLASSRSFIFVQQNGSPKTIQPNDILRVGLVSNLRGLKNLEIPACNIISYTFPTRRFADCLEQPEFYEGVAKEIRFIRNWNIGMIFLKGLAAFRRIPFLLHRIVRGKRCLATVIFSSMNRLDALFSPELPRDTEGRVLIGNVTLLEFHASVPCRRGTHLSITVNTYAGSLGFFAQYDAEKIDANTVVDWLAEWIR